MFNTTNALVLREVRYKEADRILTLLTDTDGKLTAKARGALRKNSKTAAATQQLTFSEMTLFGNKGRWTVNEAAVKEPFSGLRSDMASFALGCYFAECLDALSVEDQPDPAMLSLGLNSLYALSNGLYPPEKIKAVFELRMSCLAGYEPALESCALCGERDVREPILCMEDGCVCCRSCMKTGRPGAVPISRELLSALRAVVAAEPKRIFSFRLEGTASGELSEVCEKYFLDRMDRSFSTLDYWKKIK